MKTTCCLLLNRCLYKSTPGLRALVVFFLTGLLLMEPGLAQNTLVHAQNMPFATPSATTLPPAQGGGGPSAPQTENSSYQPGLAAVTIGSFPIYTWHDGSGPTAAGMVIGYWDQIYTWLISGSATSQTSAVDEAIASHAGSQSNWSDYALPMDASSASAVADNSELPSSASHPDNSLADFMKTSQSHWSNKYGWTWDTHIGPGLLGYFFMVRPAGYTANSEKILYQGDGSALWSRFKAEIDAGRPMVMLLDTDGNGKTDLFVTAVGYDESGGTKMYAVYNTNDTNLHWYAFAPVAVGTNNGVFEINTFIINTASAAPANDDFNNPSAISALPFSDNLDVSGASKAADDPYILDCSLAPGFNSVWYTYTPTQDISVYLDTVGSDYDTYIAIWTGARGSLASAGCNDNYFNGTFQSGMIVNLKKSTTYYFEVAEYNYFLYAAPVTAPVTKASAAPRNGASPKLSAVAGSNLAFHVSKTVSISGNTGAAGTTLNYTDGEAHSAPSDGSGNYSFVVSSNWNGSVTPFLSGTTFTPLSRTYTGLNTDQTDQNYTTFLASNVNVRVAGALQGNYIVASQSASRQSYASLNNGPVTVTSTNTIPVVASERIAYSPDGGSTWTSYAELMGLPSGKLTDTYIFPWYNSINLSSQVAFANVGSSNTTVTVTIGGVVKGSYPLTPSQSMRIKYPGLNTGPVKVQSTGSVPIVASERIAFTPDAGVTYTNYFELMGLPLSSLSDTYYYPWYNSVNFSSQVSFANVGNTSTTVTVTIGGVVRGSYLLGPNQSMRLKYAGLNTGPVKVQSSSSVPIISSERVSYTPDAGVTYPSFSEMIGLPVGQLTDNFYFPWYNSVDHSMQVSFANVGTASTTVTVTIAGVVQGSYLLTPNQSVRYKYTAVNSGPVRISSSASVPIIASERVSYTPDAGVTYTSFAEMLGLPGGQLTTTYVFPWYNSVNLNTEIRFGTP